MKKIANIRKIGLISKERRKTLGLSQKEFAGFVGTGNRFILALEQAKNNIKSYPKTGISWLKTIRSIKFISIKTSNNHFFNLTAHYEIF